MNKKATIMTCAVVGMTAGSFIPVLWGGSLLGGWSVLCSMIGGFFGIWLGAKASKKLG